MAGRNELLKTVKPILFNTEMVRAILDGRKKVTRRVIQYSHCGYFDYEPPRGVISRYQSSDILYVRETWSWCPCWDCGMDRHIVCGECLRRTYSLKKYEHGCIFYRASADDEQPHGFLKWKPSIHMPKEATRIFLRVTDERVERLQDISSAVTTKHR